MQPDASRSGFDVACYLESQTRLLATFLDIACVEKNFETYSLRLAEQILNAGSLFDSLSQSFIRWQATITPASVRFDSIKEFEKKIAGDVNFTMSDYRAIFERQFSFSSRELVLIPYGGSFFSEPFRYLTPAGRLLKRFAIKPFEKWASGAALPWWTAFTKLKHDRATYLDKATLRHAIESLGAAFVVLTFFHRRTCCGFPSEELFRIFAPLYFENTGASAAQMRRSFNIV